MYDFITGDISAEASSFFDTSGGYPQFLNSTIGERNFGPPAGVDAFPVAFPIV